MGRYAKGAVAWSDKDIETVRKLRAADVPLKDIGVAVGRSRGAVANFIARYGDRFNIKVKRSNQRGKVFSNTLSSYNGSVPYLHWTITKPWKVDNKK